MKQMKVGFSKLFGDASTIIRKYLDEKLPNASYSDSAISLTTPSGAISKKNALIFVLGYDEDDVPHDMEEKEREKALEAGHVMQFIMQLDKVTITDSETGAVVKYAYEAKPIVSVHIPEFAGGDLGNHIQKLRNLNDLAAFLRKGNSDYLSNRNLFLEEYKKGVVNDYLSGGETQKTAAERYGIAPSTLRKWLKKYSTVKN